MQHPKHSLLEAAYLFYYGTDTAFQESAEASGRLKRRLLDLIGDAIIVANAVRPRATISDPTTILTRSV